MPRQQFIFTKPVGGKGGFLPFTTAARLGSHHSVCPLWDTEGVIPTLWLFIFIPGVPSAASSTIVLGTWSPVPLMVMVEQPPIAEHIPELWIWFLDLWNSCIGKVVMSFLQETSPVFCMSFFFFIGRGRVQFSKQVLSAWVRCVVTFGGWFGTHLLRCYLRWNQRASGKSLLPYLPSYPDWSLARKTKSASACDGGCFFWHVYKKAEIRRPRHL